MHWINLQAYVALLPIPGSCFLDKLKKGIA